MKKLFLPVLFFSIAVACTKKAVPTGASVPDGAQKAVEPNKPDAKPEVTTTMPVDNMPIAPNKPSEEETGSTVFLSKCTKCHAAKTVSNYTFPQWEQILKKMIPNAKLSADEESQVVAYIRANAKK